MHSTGRAYATHGDLKYQGDDVRVSEEISASGVDFTLRGMTAQRKVGEMSMQLMDAITGLWGQEDEEGDGVQIEDAVLIVAVRGVDADGEESSGVHFASTSPDHWVLLGMVEQARLGLRGAPYARFDGEED